MISPGSFRTRLMWIMLQISRLWLCRVVGIGRPSVCWIEAINLSLKLANSLLKFKRACHMKSESDHLDHEPRFVGSVPFKFRCALIWRQIELFSRYLKFHWRVSGPAPVTPQGFKFHGNRHILAGQFEPNETRVFNRLIQDVDGLVNVGANVGYYCCLALQVGKTVIAFEPVDLNIRHLLANVRLNGWDERFELLPVCLGDHTGIVSLYGGGTGASLLRGWANSPDSHANLASINTADSLLSGRFNGTKQLILVDIEGAESLFLEGAQSLLSSEPKHDWIIEVSLNSHRKDGINPKLRWLFDQFWRNGYRSWVIEETLTEVDAKKIDTISETGEVPFKSCNFVFSINDLS